MNHLSEQPLIPGIGYWVHKGARMHPDRVALIAEDPAAGEDAESIGDTVSFAGVGGGEARGGAISYAALDGRIRRAAELLRGAGLGRGDRFAILMRNDVRLLELLFAAGQVGAVAVPLNWRLSASELAYQIEDCGAGLLFVDGEGEEAGAALESECGVRRIAVPVEYDELLAGVEAEAVAGVLWSSELPGDRDPVLQVYTSGTTGRPKGAVLTHANLFWNAINDVLALGLGWRDTTLSILPFMHSGGIGLFTMPTLLVGGTVVVPRGFDPEQTLRLIEQYRVTLFLGVPTIHRMLTESPAFEAADLGSLRAVYNGGDRCPLEVVERYRSKGLAFGGGYGLTETAPTAYLTELDQLAEASGEEGFAGKPAYSMDVRIADDAGRDVEPGEVGEILMRGPNLFAGYWNLPEETAEAWASGWFHTGDLAWRDEDGFTFIAGRKKDMIKSGGENVYPAEVERVLLEHPDVAEACVVGRADPKWNEVPIAVVVADESGLTEASLRAFCEGRLARFKIPKEFILVDVIPRTAIGKPDKPALVERYGGGGG